MTGMARAGGKRFTDSACWQIATSDASTGPCRVHSLNSLRDLSRCYIPYTSTFSQSLDSLASSLLLR